jgi:hypothetical protein
VPAQLGLGMINADCGMCMSDKYGVAVSVRQESSLLHEEMEDRFAIWRRTSIRITTRSPVSGSSGTPARRAWLPDEKET